MTTIHHSGSLTIAGLEAEARQNEEIIGPLTAIGVSGADTAVDYQVAQNAAGMPGTPLSLATFTDAPPAKPGMTVFLVGRGMIEGKEVKIAAYR
jgi:hypothetical protein